ncbi:MAG: allantoicase [Proteobacteria bacterium]|nr:allantoicase [Pseudomonadota bacterium]
MKHDSAVDFATLVNLADEQLGARALATSDDFFASMHNLLRPGRGEFDPDAYTERGKLMDGWESRRKREPGHDWCLILLGVPGIVRLFDIDTNHFMGNHPPYASVEGTSAAPDASVEELAQVAWRELLGQVPLRAGSQNIFPARGDHAVSHLRLNIFPDGGVARFRAHGDVRPRWLPPGPDDLLDEHLLPGEVDLASVCNGALALACSDSFFGPMNNLIAPDRSENMAGGWETRRRRGPGSDWIVVRLGAPGRVGMVEFDTNFFKGNYPDSVLLEGILAPDARLTELVGLDETRALDAWKPIVPQTKLQAHHRHFFRDTLADRGPFSHVRMTIFPDGGVSRLRVFGTRVGPAGRPAVQSEKP